MSHIVFSALVALVALTGCREPQIQEVDFRKFFAGNEGCIVFLSPQANRTIVFQREKAMERQSPCSTFKVVSTLLGLQAGVVIPNTRLGYDGTRYGYEAWNHDVTLEEAFRASCVWYYKKMIAQLDRQYVADALKRLNYGNCDLSAWTREGPNGFWLMSSLKISPLEQTAVLFRIFGSQQSGFSPEQVRLVRKFMYRDPVGSIGVYGKTGTGLDPAAAKQFGWFIGFLEIPDHETVYFAVRIWNPEHDCSGAEAEAVIRKIVAAGQFR